MRNVQRSQGSTLKDQRGIALVTVLLLALALSAIVAASVRISGNNDLINRYHDRHATLSSVADGALEEARARLNSGDVTLPGPGQQYVTIEEDASVTDASGEIIPNVQRSIWAGRTGDTTGRFGKFADVVTEVEDDAGNRVVRKLRLEQESFAKFAYFTDVEPSTIKFGSGDEILGPLHSNSDIRMWPCSEDGNPCVTFHDEVTTAGKVKNEQRGDFRKGFEDRVSEIPMPETEELDDLETRAANGNTAFTGMETSDRDEATTRIEFVTVDVDGNGEIEQDEGFMRVYQVDDASDAEYVSASYSYGDGLTSDGARDVCGLPESGTFKTVAEYGSDWDEDKAEDPDTRCFLGGDPALNGGTFHPDDIGPGEWLEWPGGVDSDLASVSIETIDPDYLFPLGHTRNPNFEGVIFVDGDVMLDGEVRGRITVAATGDIVLGDDLTYATPPGADDRSCSDDDLVGLFAGEHVVLADNALNTPVEPESGGDYRIYDGSDDPYWGNEYIHSVILALEDFRVENHDVDDTGFPPYGPVAATECEGEMWGRGCIFLSGGIIQETRGPVGRGSGSGYLKRYDYDQCAAEMPPPFFPTTGRFQRHEYFQRDPNNFDVEEEFENSS